MTNGEWLALALGVTLIVFTTTGNILTVWHDAPDIPRWEPVVWEYSSALGAFVALAVPWLALRLAWPGVAPWPRVALVHAAATLVFSLVHVGLFLLLRVAVYRLVGERYVVDLGLSEFLYEYGKDVLGYAICVGALWLVPRLLPSPPPPPPASEDATYVIRDGARVIRTPIGEIVAAQSAGNYVEFILADGSRPLARATLGGVEGELAAAGFVRTHRSWLVNAARVRRLTPEGSGDYAVELDGGVVAPLSRRYPATLERLRR